MLTHTSDNRSAHKSERHKSVAFDCAGSIPSSRTIDKSSEIETLPDYKLMMKCAGLCVLWESFLWLSAGSLASSMYICIYYIIVRYQFPLVVGWLEGSL